MKAELIDMMGDDLTVVNAARVSFNKESDWEWDSRESGYGGERVVLSEKDQKLINYLAKHDHWTPFSHVMIQMRETVPIFVARQRFKHMVGFTYNEVSGRYDTETREFWAPGEWRGAPENKKQGSSDEIVEEKTVTFAGVEFDYDTIVQLAADWYFTNDHIASEQRRAILAQSMYTSYYVTGSLAAWARAYKLRSDEHAQKEIRDLATQWNEIISGISEVKHSWNALVS